MIFNSLFIVLHITISTLEKSAASLEHIIKEMCNSYLPGGFFSLTKSTDAYPNNPWIEPAEDLLHFMYKTTQFK